MKVVNQRGQCL